MTPPTPILMFHSIADGEPGPVSLPRATFREQMLILADAGAQAISVSEYVAGRAGLGALPPNAVVLTFDDGYQDFADVAAPELQRRGWHATVFLPIEPVDRGESWDCGDGCRRAPLSWAAVRELATAGFEFGSHGLTHRDLTRLQPKTARHEVEASGRLLTERAGRDVGGFAPPFGRMPHDVQSLVRDHYRWSVTTTMSVADDHDDLYALPRVEMWYFRHPRRWRDFVTRGVTPYFRVRRRLRALRRTLAP